MSDRPKLSPVEQFKADSRYLRGEIADELEQASPSFGKSSIQILKHHGTYQQDDRDQRAEARKAGADKAYMMMVRTRIPGGRLTADQLLAHLQLGDELGNGTIRLTTRQAIQLHGILKSDLRSTIRRICESQLTTLGACGDVNRNVMCCPAACDSEVHQEIQAFSQALAEHFAPRSGAYQELWLRDLETGDKVEVPLSENPLSDDQRPAEEVEPIYGKVYLPRKFKMAIALPDDNCTDVYTQDVGLIAVVRDGRLAGFNVLAGGGQGVTPSNQKTFPALGFRLCYADKNDALAVVQAIVEVQRDHGNRADRKQARLKYLIHRLGIEGFRELVQQQYGRNLLPCEPDDVQAFNDHLGWEPQSESEELWSYGLNVENGRIADDERQTLKSALREICGELNPGIRLTSHQSLIFTNIPGPRRGELESLLRKHNILLSEQVSTVRRWSMACVAWPTCGLAITESERALPGVIDQFESALQELGLQQEPFTIRMTGCPNGCARPYNSDIGLVGKAQGRYTIYLGGRLVGNRLNALFKDLVPLEEIVPTLVPVFELFREQRGEAESFGDFCDRIGNEVLLKHVEQRQTGAA